LRGYYPTRPSRPLNKKRTTRMHCKGNRRAFWSDSKTALLAHWLVTFKTIFDLSQLVANQVAVWTCK
jgi:hypothetical protein